MPKWHFKELDPDYPDDSALAERNFRRESTELPEIFVRELVQNVLDARTSLDQPARVTINLMGKSDGLSSSNFRKIIEELEPHLQGAGHEVVRDYSNPTALVIEEFGTVGLTGNVSDSRAQGETERWANFWHGEGKRSKQGKSLGRAGQGKITYHMASGARTLLAYSVRDSLKEPECVFGKCIVNKTYKVGSNWYMRHMYWCVENITLPKQPLPAHDSKTIHEFKSIFGLKRDLKKTGTSWVIPFPHTSLSKQSLIAGLLKDFHFTILKGSLTANVCGQEIDKTNVISLIPHYVSTAAISENFLSFLQSAVSNTSRIQAVDGWGWTGEAVSAESFSAEELTKLKTAFENGELVSVRFPLSIEKRDGTTLNSFFDAYLMRPEDLKHTEELYIRSDLVIGDEKHLKQAPGAAFGLMLAEEANLSELLGYAEEASHLKWNAAEDDLVKHYNLQSARDVLSRVRRSLPRLCRLLAGHTAGIDEDALKGILFVPEDEKGRKKVSRPKKKVGPTPTPPPIPKPKPKDYSVREIKGGISIFSTNGTAIIGREIRVIFAYDQIEGEGNPFKNYHPFDFDLSQSSMTITANGATILRQEENVLVFKIDTSLFDVSVTGFDVEMRLKCRAALLTTSPAADLEA